MGTSPATSYQYFRDVEEAVLALARSVGEQTAPLPGAPGVAPYAAAAPLVAMMARMAAFHVDLEPYGVSRADVVETTARTVFRTVTG